MIFCPTYMCLCRHCVQLNQSWPVLGGCSQMKLCKGYKSGLKGEFLVGLGFVTSQMCLWLISDHFLCQTFVYVFKTKISHLSPYKSSFVNNPKKSFMIGMAVNNSCISTYEKQDEKSYHSLGPGRSLTRNQVLSIVHCPVPFRPLAVCEQSSPIQRSIIEHLNRI